MIFIGAELKNPDSHFVTNIVDCIGNGNDLLIDLLACKAKDEIFAAIAEHLRRNEEKYVLYNAYEDEDFFLSFQSEFPSLKLVMFFSDDEWRHANYNRYLALFADEFAIAVRANMALYRDYGLQPTYMQWACNPMRYYPLPEQSKTYDVTFVGAAYGKRIEYIRRLVEEGIDVQVFGRGWDRVAATKGRHGGYLSQRQVLEVVSQSKINLNFLWTSAEPERATIKGRTMELAACKAFQLSTYTEEFHNYGFLPGDNIASFDDEADLVRKVKYYLVNAAEREAIAERSYNHVLKYHTWPQRFKDIGRECNMRGVVPPGRRYKIRVIVSAGANHQIKEHDVRMDIQLVRAPSKDFEGVDGVLFLARDTTITNDALFMMAFGLCVDRADLIISNFAAIAGNRHPWVRFGGREMESSPSLLRMLPKECCMFSATYAASHGCRIKNDVKAHISYIEYPAFGVNLPYIWARLLRMYFGHSRNARDAVIRDLMGLKVGRAISLLVDKVWQRTFLKRGAQFFGG